MCKLSTFFILYFRKTTMKGIIKSVDYYRQKKNFLDFFDPNKVFKIEYSKTCHFCLQIARNTRL
jgi:hypothetical protein